MKGLNDIFIYIYVYKYTFKSRTRFRDPCPLLSHFLFLFAVALCAQAFVLAITTYCLLIQGRGFAILVLCFRISYFSCRRALRPGFCFRIYYLLSFNSRTRFRDPCPLFSHFLFLFAVALRAQALAFRIIVFRSCLAIDSAYSEGIPIPLFFTQYVLGKPLIWGKIKLLGDGFICEAHLPKPVS